jgi:pimeloyl-ACP methyl ester carboxylesterase
MNHHRRLVPLMVLCFSLALISCQTSDERPEYSTPPDATAGYIQMQPDVYTVEGVDFPCHSGFIVVPENRDDPDARLISIPITQIHATGPNPLEPIFWLDGGPGASNFGEYRFVADLSDKHDIVLVGYRGIDGTVLLDGAEVDEFFRNIPSDLTGRASVELMADANARCAKRHQDAGVDTDGYTVVEVIHDVEAVRVALGYGQLNLLSGSYGTRLAMIYDWMYPDSIFRSAMIAVNPPGHFEWQASVIDDQIQYYSRLYAEDAEYGGRVDDLAETLRTTARDMPETWLFFPIKRGNVLMGTFMMLYHTSSAPAVFDAWIAASEGDWSGIALMSMMIDYMIPGASVWGESAAKASSVDYVFEPGSDPYAEFMPPESIFGAPASLLGFAAHMGWPSKVIHDSLRHVRDSDTETLLIGGSIDFSTPARFARDELLPHLSNGHQVILKEFGHTGDVWTKQRPALIHMLRTFYDTGEVDDSRFVYAPMSFAVQFSYPTMMKLGLGAVVFVVIIFGVTVWLVVRKIRRRSAR